MLSRSPILSSVVIALIAGGTTIIACSSSSSSGGGDTITDSGSQDAASDVATGPLAVVPATANVLTCDTLQFKETGGAGNGVWSVAPSGSIDTKSGLFTAPNTTPASPASTITYTEAPASATGTVQIATAFLGTPATLPTTSNPLAIGQNSPFEHEFTANGSRVYAAVMGATVASGPVLEADVYISNDSGKTFTEGAKYHTGNLQANCVTAAVDAVNPDVVYMVYLAGHGDSTSNTGQTLRLAVSTDGAKTFPVEYDVADSLNLLGPLVCPDVVSPSGDHVMVTGVASDGSGSEAATWVSDSRGANIGPVATEGVMENAEPDGGTFAASDTNRSAYLAGCTLASNIGSGLSPRFFSNTTGTACVAYGSDFGHCDPADGGTENTLLLQCTTNNGTTWSAAQVIATPSTDNIMFGAVSPSGNVAVAWQDMVGSNDEVFVRFSKDTGKTFGAPIQYPSASRNALVASSYSGNAVVTWESDNILWFSETLDSSDTPAILIDKTCDFGATWSGALNAGAYEGTSLLQTANGMVLTGWVKGRTASVTIPLSGN